MKRAAPRQRRPLALRIVLGGRGPCRCPCHADRNASGSLRSSTWLRVTVRVTLRLRIGRLRGYVTLRGSLEPVTRNHPHPLGEANGRAERRLRDANRTIVDSSEIQGTKRTQKQKRLNKRERKPRAR